MVLMLNFEVRHRSKNVPETIAWGRPVGGHRSFVTSFEALSRLQASDPVLWLSPHIIASHVIRVLKCINVSFDNFYSSMLSTQRRLYVFLQILLPSF
ncbi:hypothetical protein JB92DRAFT_1659388 [Gautieria morchelliformis]|nr:hypothetical protein JB92DRAFT_1659388 [Gautieria morchelliformis]